MKSQGIEHLKVEEIVYKIKKYSKDFTMMVKEDSLQK